MNPFRPDDPTMGRLGTRSAQYIPELWKHKTDNTPRPKLPKGMMYYNSRYYQQLGVTDISNTSKLPYSTENTIGDKEFQATLKRIKAIFDEKPVSLSNSMQKSIINNGLKKIKETLGDEIGKSIKHLIESSKTNAQVKNTTLSLVFFSSLYNKDTLMTAKKVSHHLVIKLVEFKHFKKNDPFDMDLCHQLSDRIFNTITGQDLKSHYEKIEKTFQPGAILDRVTSIGRGHRIFSDQQKAELIKLINGKYSTEKEIILADLSVNRLVQTFNLMNFVYSISDSLETTLFLKNKHGDKKCQAL